MEHSLVIIIIQVVEIQPENYNQIYPFESRELSENFASLSGPLQDSQQLVSAVDKGRKAPTPGTGMRGKGEVEDFA